MADRPGDARGLGVLRLRAARGLRGPAARPRRRSRSPIRPPRGRRRGRRGRRSCSSRCCSACARRAERLATVAPPRSPSWAGDIRAGGRAGLRPRVGAFASRTPGRASSEDRGDQPGLVPGAADGLRRDRVGRLAPRRRARRRRPRRDALRLGRLAHEGEALVGVPGRAERADRPDAPRAPALPRRLRARGRVRRDQRPLRPAGGGDRRPDRQAGAAHDPRAARRRGRRDLRADRRGRAADRLHLDLDEPAQAEAGLPLGGELPERARLLAVPRASRTAATTCCSSAG